MGQISFPIGSLDSSTLFWKLGEFTSIHVARLCQLASKTGNRPWNNLLAQMWLQVINPTLQDFGHKVTIILENTLALIYGLECKGHEPKGKAKRNLTFYSITDTYCILVWVLSVLQMVHFCCIVMGTHLQEQQCTVRL